MLAPLVMTYEPRGTCRELFHRRDPELVVSGPAGTGKSLACLHKLHLAAALHPGMRGLMLRKVRQDMHQSCQQQFERQVGALVDGVYFRSQEQEYRYPNGSVVVVAGLDRPGRVMSAQYDFAYLQEGTQATEDDWELVTSRLRNGVMPYQQLLADCNPDAPSHWLKKRADNGQTALLISTHEDNPRLFDASGQMTPEGRDYVEGRLDRLTGVRRLRLRLGQWAAAEGMVYAEEWDRSRNLIDPFEIPRSWRRIWVVDFGYTNPLCWQAWAIDPDGRAYRYRELYETRQLVEDVAPRILDLTKGEPAPEAIICDHDAEDRATLERHLGPILRGRRTVAATKAISTGIEAVRARLRPAGDGKPRAFLMRGALVKRDPELVEAKRPTCTEEEIEEYIYPTASRKNRPLDEVPVKENDHGMDCLRYLVAHLDVRGSRRLNF